MKTIAASILTALVLLATTASASAPPAPRPSVGGCQTVCPGGYGPNAPPCVVCCTYPNGQVICT